MLVFCVPFLVYFINGDAIFSSCCQPIYVDWKKVLSAAAAFSLKLYFMNTNSSQFILVKIYENLFKK
jgi:hypothetical protein